MAKPSQKPPRKDSQTVEEIVRSQGAKLARYRKIDARALGWEEEVAILRKQVEEIAHLREQVKELSLTNLCMFHILLVPQPHLAH